MKSFGSNVKERIKAKVSLNKYGTIQFESREKTKFPKGSIPNYQHNEKNCKDLLNVVKKILFCLNINKIAGMGQILAKFLKIAEDVLAYPPFRIINLSVKLSVFQKNIIFPS